MVWQGCEFASSSGVSLVLRVRGGSVCVCVWGGEVRGEVVLRSCTSHVRYEQVTL